jgi:predicted small lipoprotein YifL
VPRTDYWQAAAERLLLRAMKILIVMAALLALAACRQEGPAEKAGRQLDQAGEKASKSIEQAGKDIRDATRGKK